MTAKQIMQLLCKTQAGWDDEAPPEIVNAWAKLQDELHELETIKIPRWIHHRRHNKIELHGFCDASQKGCAAVIYARTIDISGRVHTTLLTAKTKVAPLKQAITLPRLELCGALLLARLFSTTIASIGIESPNIFAWCDSEITLAWIAKNPNTWNTYVAHRVSEIQKLVPNVIWRYIASQENPADPASRGISPRKLVSHKIWWRGPLWLSQPPHAWPTNKLNLETCEEISKAAVKVHNIKASVTESFTCSTFTRQVRVVAYCRRFINNCKLAKTQRTSGYLTTKELDDAKTCIIKVVQQEAFHDEIISLKAGNRLKTTSRLLSLSPTLDSKEILRVGGRITNSNLSFDSKHQILLPQKHRLTEMIIDHAHKQTLHGGTQLTLSYIRSRYWIIDAKRMIQSRIHRCITCLKYRQQPSQPLMGNLPTVRVTPSPPFSHCGIDYAGPFLTKMAKVRGTKTLKGYIALFICMVTKAVHLELVTDLSTNAFLAAYRRFVARRGNCKEIFTDNGTNFVGARNKLDKDLQLAISQSTRTAAEVTAIEGTQWKFIPPASPNFGGLWEAGVKSVKTHLKRVLGETLLTYEEFTTVLCQVEACLNSRPISQQSCDPRDLEPLTPGHFIIGRPLLAPPEPEMSNTHAHDRWKQIIKYHQHIWQRWSDEYLTTLQQRSKWRILKENPNIGELVVVKEEHLPPQKWTLGRIIELHPGEDGIVRVVSVQHKNGVKKRPLNKLCQLPANIYESDAEPRTTGTNTATDSHNPTKRTTAPQVNVSNSTTETSDHLPTKKRKRDSPSRNWTANLLHSVLLMFYWLSVALAQDVKLFHPRSGLYIENIGYSQIKRGNLRLQISFPLNEIIHDQKVVNNTWGQIRDMCQKSKELSSVTHCESLLQHLSAKRENLLKSTNELIQLSQTHTKSRSRRGLLGKLLNSVFGVNDEVYTDIETLQRNQQSLLQTTGNQALLLNTKINQTAFFIQQKLKQFDIRLNRVITSINEMATWYGKADHNRISIEVISTYLTAEDYLDELQEKYNQWLNAIHGYGHILNFVTTTDIAQTVKRAEKTLSSNVLISRTPQSHVDVRCENNTVILYGYLNLVENNVYDLIHVTPTPHMIGNNTLLVADLKHSMIAVNFDQQTYFNLAEQEFKACTVTEDHVYLCTPTIVHNIEDSPSCVIDEIYQRHSKTPCEIRQAILNGTIWNALMMENTWLYVTSQPRVAAVICNGKRQELLLNSTGIIHLENGCIIQTREITLKASTEATVKVLTTHYKEIIPVNDDIKFGKPPSILKSGVLIKPNEQIFDYTTEAGLMHTATLQKTLAVHSTIATSSILGVLILTIIIYKHRNSIYKGFNFCNRRKTTAQKGRRSLPPTPIQAHFDRVLSSITSSNGTT